MEAFITALFSVCIVIGLITIVSDKVRSGYIQEEA